MEFELTAGEARAVVTAMGATLRVYEVAGVPYLETFADKPVLGSGCVLVPWPNRVGGGTWRWQGEVQQLEVSEPGHNAAIHGLVRHQVWDVVEQHPDRVVLATGIPVQAGWPVPLHTSIEYALAQDGLTVTHRVKNVGDAPVPFGVGTHPYPRAAGADRDECELQLSASTVLTLEPESMMPVGPAQPVAGTDFDFSSPRKLAGRDFDTPFGGCEPAEDGLIHHRLTGPNGGIEIWAEPDFRWIQVFTPAEFAGRGAGVVAVEPMTCPPDALNSGVDLLTVEPGQEWAGRWGFRPL